MTPFPITPRRSLLAVLRTATGTVLTVAAIVVASLMLLPTALGLQRYVIVSGSMTGTYDTGSIVYDHEVPTSSLRVGDVITYAPPAGASPHKLVTHRIVQIGRDDSGTRLFRTKGDANPVADPWRFVLDRPRQAEVSFGIPYIGYAFSELSRREVRLWVIAAPAVLIALLSVGGLFRDGRREQRELAASGTPGAPGAPSAA